jgi:hypothetical protein
MYVDRTHFYSIDFRANSVSIVDFKILSVEYVLQGYKQTRVYILPFKGRRNSSVMQ